MRGKGVVLLLISAASLGAAAPAAAGLTNGPPGLPRTWSMTYPRGGVVAVAPTAARWDAALYAPTTGAADDAPKQAQDDPAPDPFEEPFGRQLRQLYRSELHFLRVVCQPTREQYDRILAESPTEKATVRKLAAMMREPQEGRGLDGARSV